MKKISSRLTFVSKRVFPVFWFGYLALFVTTAFRTGGVAENPIFLIGPAAMAVFGFFLLKKLVWDLVDEVYDCGDSLLIRNGDQEERVAFADIMNVNVSTLQSPPRITLRLRTAGRFGREIAFSPVSSFTLNPFAKNPIGEDLIERVDTARSRRRMA